MPSLSITDNANGTGGVADISGAGVGNTVTLYSFSVSTGELGGTPPVFVGQRVGDGTIPFSIPMGYYWFVAIEDTVSLPSNFVYQNISNGLTAPHYRCLLAVHARIAGLIMEGIAAQRVTWRKHPHFRGLAEPGVVVVPIIETMPTNAGTNARDDTGYGVLAVGFQKKVSDTDEDQYTENAARMLKWRDQMKKAMREWRLAGVPESIRTTVEPGGLFVPSEFSNQFDVEALAFRCTCRETRGLT
jgi:hypothetical protein